MFELPNLPYAHDALEPVISQATMHLHHGKHHKRYFDVMNQMLQESGAKPASLEDVVRGAVGQAKLFNNSAQAWNHTFFWECMSPPGQKVSGDLAAAIDRDFGGLEQLKAQFVAKGDTLTIVDTHDGVNLLTEAGVVPLLVADLWEHAYYLDHKNDREGFLKAWFDALPNWAFAQAQYDAARKGETGWTHPGPV